MDTRSTDIVMKILLDLNVKKKITMIMVTHDVGLKTFANRVVRMADGKVNKIEEIDPAQRAEHIRHLDDRVRAIHSGSQKDVLTIREGIKEQDDETSKLNPSGKNGKVVIPDNFSALKNVTTTKTSVRRPQDYPVLRERFHNPLSN